MAAGMRDPWWALSHILCKTLFYVKRINLIIKLFIYVYLFNDLFNDINGLDYHSVQGN
jgi:hypothetical protein